MEFLSSFLEISWLILRILLVLAGFALVFTFFKALFTKGDREGGSDLGKINFGQRRKTRKNVKLESAKKELGEKPSIKDWKGVEH